jgi:hypothetical protein
LEEATIRLAEQYVFFYGLAILLSGLVLMGIGVQQIEIYYAIYLIEFLVATELVASLRKSLDKNIRPFIIIFLAGFLYIVIERVIQILR